MADIIASPYKNSNSFTHTHSKFYQQIQDTNVNGVTPGAQGSQTGESA